MNICKEKRCEHRPVSDGLCIKHNNQERYKSGIKKRTIRDLNTIEKKEKYCFLHIHGGFENPEKTLYKVRFDRAFFLIVRQFKWRSHYGKARSSEEGYLHNFLMKPPTGYYIHFKNEDDRDCTIENMIYKPKRRLINYDPETFSKRKRTVDGKKFYVYLYIDLRKPGKYSYAVNDKKYVFDFEPFYVGKGSGKRAFDIKRQKHNKFCTRKVQNILDETDCKIQDIVKGKYCEDEGDAFQFEIDFIAAIGRLNAKTGPLINFTTGGTGGSNGLKRKYKTYILYNKNNKKHVVKNLPQFCKENNLNLSSMRVVVSGNAKSNKGWTVGMKKIKPIKSVSKKRRKKKIKPIKPIKSVTKKRKKK